MCCHNFLIIFAAVCVTSVVDILSYNKRCTNQSDCLFQKNSLLWILYNDQAPNKTYSSELGHTKGVVMSETVGGLWLVHSVPYFPPAPTNNSRSEGYSYPKSGRYFGQSFLCISLTDSQMDLVGLWNNYVYGIVVGFVLILSLVLWAFKMSSFTSTERYNLQVSENTVIRKYLYRDEVKD